MSTNVRIGRSRVAGSPRCEALKGLVAGLAQGLLQVLPQQTMLQPVQVLMPQHSMTQLQHTTVSSQMMLQQEHQARLQRPMARKHIVSGRNRNRGIQHNFINSSRVAQPPVVYAPYTHVGSVVPSQGPGASNVQ